MGITPRSLNVKLVPRRNYHKGQAAIRHYANSPSIPYDYCVADPISREHSTTFTLYSRAIICKYLSLSLLPGSVIGPPLDLNTISVKVYTSVYNAGTASDEH